MYPACHAAIAIGDRTMLLYIVFLSLFNHDYDILVTTIEFIFNDLVNKY